MGYHDHMYETKRLGIEQDHSIHKFTQQGTCDILCGYIKLKKNIRFWRNYDMKKYAINLESTH